jgi:hydroxymethylpyrimidine/phosphomethylpyrimidine kinase
MGPLPMIPAAPRRPRALTIAGSDSGGGAGIQADLKTFSAYGVFAMTAITAITVQNTEGVSGYEAVSAAVVAAQIRSVATDIGVDAAKTGMLASAAIVEAVADVVVETGIANLVVDPVFVSTHGNALMAAGAVGAVRASILPLATIVTPNLSEAAGLTGIEVATRDDMRRAADALLDAGANAVLVKGGHLPGTDDAGESADLFADGEREEWLVAERIDTANTHGTGCTLSAAIAASLAGGAELLEAVRSGKAFVTEAIRHALPLGRGIGPVDQLWPVPPLSGGRA